MSAICGSTSDSRRTRVAGMNAAMAYRGSEDVRTFTDFLSGLSLGSRQLRVFDARGGRRLVSNENGTVWAALDGEIYNHPELREALSRRGHRFSSGVDTEVLVHLYEDYGAAMVEVLEGMYAFALWDGRREELPARLRAVAGPETRRGPDLTSQPTTDQSRAGRRRRATRLS
jgi:asparagine synthase (glutamine-hydrolysing)